MAGQGKMLPERRVTMSRYRKFTPEYREEAVKLVLESDRPIAEIARELGINEGTLGNWVNKYRREHPVSEELSLPDRAKLRELERENRDLRLQNEFLKKAAAYFAKEQS
jgi:transposase